MLNKIRFGIVGYGKMGKIRARSIYKSKDSTLISIYDTSNFELDNNNIKKCKSFDELISDDIDAIFISTYVKFSSDYVIRSLKSGKHVFCEKPPSMNSDEMELVIEAEKKYGKVLKYGFNHRVHNSVIEAKSIINEGKLGKILWMRGVYGKAGSIDFHENWRNYKKFSGGGILLDQGIHMLDLFRYFSQENLNLLHSHITKSFWDIECEDNAFIIMNTKSGTVATLHSSATQWQHKFLLEIEMEKGYINLDGILSETRSYAPEKIIIGLRETENYNFAMGKPTEKIQHFEYDNSWDLELEEFIFAIKNNSKIVNGNSNDALQIMKLVDKIYSNSEIYK